MSSVVELAKNVDLAKETLDKAKTSFEEAKKAFESSKVALEEAKKAFNAASVELRKEIGVPEPKARTRTSNQPTLKGVIKSILSASEGMTQKEIASKVRDLITSGEYKSTAASTEAIVSQALDKLKKENAVVHNKESHTYSLCEQQ